MMTPHLEIKAYEMTEVLTDRRIELSLRYLSLGRSAGMQTQLDNFKSIMETRKPEAKAVVAYMEEKAVGWALFSREATSRHAAYDPTKGVLIYLYVSDSYRRKGIGSSILVECRFLAGSEKLCVCPWDERSQGFYNKHHDKGLFDTLPMRQVDIEKDYIAKYSYGDY